MFQKASKIRREFGHFEGGGDIKLIGATGFVLGYAKTSTACLTAIALAILFCSLYYLGKRNMKDHSFPFAPFFQIGCAIVMVTGGLSWLKEVVDDDINFAFDEDDLPF